MNEKTSVSYLDSPQSLKEASNIIGHSLDTFQFVEDLHWVLVLLGLSHFGSDDRVCHTWL